MNNSSKVWSALLIGLVTLAGCASPANEDEPEVSTRTVREGADLHVTVISDGETVATLDYVAQAHEARWSTRVTTTRFEPMSVASLEEADAGSFARALWTATQHVGADGPSAGSLRPREIFYTRQGPTCTPTSFCEPFYGGWACVSLYADCSGKTWIEL